MTDFGLVRHLCFTVFSTNSDSVRLVLRNKADRADMYVYNSTKTSDINPKYVLYLLIYKGHV